MEERRGCKKGDERKRDRKRNLLSMGSFSNDCNGCGWAEPWFRFVNLICIFYVGSRDPITWFIACYVPWCTLIGN